MRTTVFARRALALAVVLAAAACGEPAGVDDGEGEPPTIVVLSPTHMPQGDRMLVGRMHVRAHCGEGPRCASLSAYVNDALVARGVDSVNVLVPLAKWEDTVRVRFEAKGRDGSSAGTELRRFLIEPSPLWTELFTTPGPIRDAAPDRAVYALYNQDQLRLRKIATGEDISLLHSETNVPNGYAWLTPVGVIVDLGGTSYPYKEAGIFEIGGSEARADPGSNAAARSRWAAWNDTRHIYRDDVMIPALAHSSHLAGSYDLAADGTIAYEGYADTTRFFDGPVQIFLFRPGGGPDLQVTFDTLTTPINPQTDGTLVAYTRRLAVPDGRSYELVLITPGGGETVLAGPITATTPYESPFRYDVEAGWVVFSIDAAREAGLLARAPSGEVRALGVPGSRGTLLALGPAAQVVVASEGRWYHAASPTARAVDFGASTHPAAGDDRGAAFRWYGGKLHVIFGTSLFRIDL